VFCIDEPFEETGTIRKIEEAILSKGSFLKAGVKHY
jgi:hypothetical protein